MILETKLKKKHIRGVYVCNHQNGVQNSNIITDDKIV